jgi:hypothetical protein
MTCTGDAETTSTLQQALQEVWVRFLQHPSLYNFRMRLKILFHITGGSSADTVDFLGDRIPFTFTLHYLFSPTIHG